MTATDKLFAGSVPALYARLMVPMIFEDYAQDMTDRLIGLQPAQLLEIAAGTGVLTRAMADRLRADIKITATDLNQPMLDMAIERQRDDPRIVWQQADAQALPFADGAFDAAVCQFGVMFFPDKVQAFREVHRVLQPGSTYIFDVWDKLETNDFVTVVQQVLDQRFGQDTPRFMERAPHGYWNFDTIREQLHEAAFSSVEIETVDHLSRADSALAAATAYCQGTPLRNEIEARAAGELQAVTDMVADALEKRFGDGPIEGKIRAFIVTAVK